MSKLFRTEFKKLTHNNLVIYTIIVMVLLSMLLSNIKFGKLPSTLKGLAYQTGDGRVLSRGEFVFFRTMIDPNLTVFLTMIFPILFISNDFSNRTINQNIFSGYSRSKIFIVKVIEFYFITCLVSFLYPLISNLMYSIPWFNKLSYSDIKYVFRCLGMRLLTDMAFMSIGLIIAYAIRDMVKALATTFLIPAVFLPSSYIILEYIPSNAIVKYIMFIYPPYQVNFVMKRQLVLQDLFFSISISLILIIVSIVISYRIFRKADLN